MDDARTFYRADVEAIAEQFGALSPAGCAARAFLRAIYGEFPDDFDDDRGQIWKARRVKGLLVANAEATPELADWTLATLAETLEILSAAEILAEQSSRVH